MTDNDQGSPSPTPEPEPTPPATTAPPPVFCSKCGTQAITGSTFCGSCGAPLTTEPTGAASGSGATDAESSGSGKGWIIGLLVIILVVVVALFFFVANSDGDDEEMSSRQRAPKSSIPKKTTRRKTMAPVTTQTRAVKTTAKPRVMNRRTAATQPNRAAMPEARTLPTGSKTFWIRLPNGSPGSSALSDSGDGGDVSPDAP